MGPSGGGKTTVSRLAARFWDADRGRITVGGMDVSKADPEALLSLYSIVFQDVTLFDNTILRTSASAGRTPPTAECIAAARLANVDEFAEKLPGGWNTGIGENGCQLSGGERQRISIARAFLKNAPIILLDEATASPGRGKRVPDPERPVPAHPEQDGAGDRSPHAHRGRGGQRLVVLERGVAAEQGSPAELMKQGGIYAHMVRTQAESQRWAL